MTKHNLRKVFFVSSTDQKKENMVKDFWILNEKKIKTWYWENKKKSDIIISASPEFLLFPVTEKLEIGRASCRERVSSPV